MSVHKKLKSIHRDLRQAPSKIDGLFKVTDFNRLLSAAISTSNEVSKNKQYSLESEIKVGILSVLTKSKYQREFSFRLDLIPNWLKICNLSNDALHQTTLSRWWNDERVLETLDNLFVRLQDLISLKRFRKETKPNKSLEKYYKKNYQLLAIDSTVINLSPKKYKYAKKVYRGVPHEEAFGARLHLLIDLFNGYPVNYIPSGANEHDSPYANILIDNWIDNEKYWLKNDNRKSLIPLITADRGYWNKERFLDWTNRKILFITPKKKRTLTNCQIEFENFPNASSNQIQGSIWFPQNTHSFRIIFTKTTRANVNWLETITNDNNLNGNDIVKIYSKRWIIEEEFKWIKQHLTLQNPLSTSWIGLVIHLYLILILFCILLYFIALLQINQWELVISNIWIQLTSDPLVEWSFTFLNDYLLVLSGIQKD